MNALHKPWILGLSRNFHSGAACLIHGEDIVAAVQEERLTRFKRGILDCNNSFLCVEYCMNAAEIKPSDLDLIVECSCISEPGKEFRASRLNAILGDNVPFMEISHHIGHAASVAGPSGFDEATVLIVDGGGSLGSRLNEDERKASPEWDSKLFEHLSIYHYIEGAIRPVDKHMSFMPYLKNLRKPEMPEFASLGHMFSSVAYQIFGDYLEAGKVMGLAPYGKASIEVENFFTYSNGRFCFSDLVPKQYRNNMRWPDNKENYIDLAASVQRALEIALELVAAKIRELGLPRKLCYAGGVALNSVANHKVFKNLFDNVFVLPASEDSGTAIGAAFYGLAKFLPKRRPSVFKTDYLGRSFSKEAITAAIAKTPNIQEVETTDILETIVDLLMTNQIVAWFEGGSEFGPRALGHRSILCDPRRKDGKEVLNSRVKHREAFRPFAPIVLNENMGDWFEMDKPSRLTDFMLEVCNFKNGIDLPAVVHVDGTGRIQTITRVTDLSLYELIFRFHRKTGVPILVNTSFNIMGEPIVETPRDALWCFLATGIDYLYLAGRLIKKADDYNVMKLVLKVNSDLAVSQNEPPALICKTEHGPYKRPISEDFVPLVRAFLTVIDGKSSIREIIQRMCNLMVEKNLKASLRSNPNYDYAAFARSILWHLMQFSAIDLQAPPSP